VIRGGRAATTEGKLSIRSLPIIDIHTVGARGGSMRGEFPRQPVVAPEAGR
jgi:hypothetical protein